MLAVSNSLTRSALAEVPLAVVLMPGNDGRVRPVAARQEEQSGHELARVADDGELGANVPVSRDDGAVDDDRLDADTEADHLSQPVRCAHGESVARDATHSRW